MIELPRLMLVADRRAARGRDLVELLPEIAQRGVRLIQLREPDLADDELRRLVDSIQSRLPRPAMLLINDRPALARELDCGLHLPARSAAPAEPRPRPFGRSVHGDAELEHALRECPDYVVAGHVFATASKQDAAGRGIDWLRRLCGRAAPVPVFAIGGLEASGVSAVLSAGAHGVAVRSGILSADEPERAALAILQALARRRTGSERPGLQAAGRRRGARG